MAKINYADKDHTLPSSNERKHWNDNDANEVKTVVNQNAEQMFRLLGGWDASGNSYPTNGNGSGDAGAVMQFDAWYFTQPAPAIKEDPDDPSATSYRPRRTIAIALANNPGQDPAKWRLI